MEVVRYGAGGMPMTKSRREKGRTSRKTSRGKEGIISTFARNP